MNERSEVCEQQRIGRLNDMDPSPHRVVLMCHAIVQGLADHPRIILRYFLRKQRSTGQMANRKIANLLKNLVAGKPASN